MINRKALGYLREWKSRATRKPLVVRGARQVGKTSLVVDLFGASEFESVVKIDFEAMEGAGDYFRSKDPDKIVPLLEVATGQRIIDGKTLLFLDEIQAQPQVLATLRYFGSSEVYEKIHWGFWPIYRFGTHCNLIG